MVMRNPWPMLVALLALAGGAHADETPPRCADPEMENALETAMRGLSGKPARLLALSGGGQFGAYGAGFLRGWRDSTEEPKRPEVFEMVSGTSTGALIATFPFLGTKEDDDKIVAEYQNIRRDSDVYSNRFFLKLLWKDSLTTRAQFRRRLTDRVITAEVVRRVGEQGRLGRRLLVGAVDIETGCFRYFDLTRLAEGVLADGVTDKEKEKIRQDYVDRLMASTAIPVQFEPVLIQEKGQNRPSIYVDGGVRRNLFIGPLMEAATAFNIDLSVYIMFNGERGVNAADRKQLLSGIKLAKLAGRAVSMLLDESTEGNLFRVYLQLEDLKQRHGADKVKTEVRFTAIPPDVAKECGARDADEDKNFNGRTIDCLVKHGEILGKSGKVWLNDPLAPIP
jgi:predicted acylesterase/phospholipase RssA